MRCEDGGVLLTVFGKNGNVAEVNLTGDTLDLFADMFTMCRDTLRKQEETTEVSRSAQHSS